MAPENSRWAFYAKNPLKMGNYTIFQMFENPRTGRQAKNVATNVQKILSRSQIVFFSKIFSENWRWVPLIKPVLVFHSNAQAIKFYSVFRDRSTGKLRDITTVHNALLSFCSSQELMNQPVSMACGHSACKACLQEMLSNAFHRQTCPLCRDPINPGKLNINLAVKALISRIGDRCSNDGCGWVGKHSEMHNHGESCPCIYANTVPQWLCWDPEEG